ncbi:MAG: hypothetical protein NVV63_12510 [Opitutus sp.]|nr:hypothetical protein [Opitutus sp.]
MVHIGLREKPYVLDPDGVRFDLPADCARLNGQRISVVADPSTFNATIQ